ncbi:hypothetical protein BV20DRAFT_967170 [Pilatotrama ljubarskyi]|nr:hypothetical protein BV20DRAFT_967170 [Pilatotrama ljubarskyi]
MSDLSESAREIHYPLAYAASHVFFPILCNIPHLTHLHLDYDITGASLVGSGVWTGITLPTVTFLRTRTYPCCGVSASTCTYGGTIHNQDCNSEGLERAFPNLRELHVDAPIFLEYFGTPRLLQSVTIDASPAMKLMCSIQGYNIWAALKQGFLAPEGRAGRRAPGSCNGGEKTIVVRTGVTIPLGCEVKYAQLIFSSNADTPALTILACYPSGPDAVGCVLVYR